MADITYNEIKSPVSDALNTTLSNYTYGRGNNFLQVMVGGKEIQDIIKTQKDLKVAQEKSKESTDKLIDELDSNSDNLKTANDLSKTNNEILKKNTEALNSQGKSWEAYLKQGIKVAAEIVGFMKDRAVRELDITKTIGETNTMYIGTAKELNQYANRMNMSLDEYTSFMKENASEFNNIQRALGDVRTATALDFRKMTQQTGATQNEMNKALASYTKMVSQNGEINSMTTEQFTAGATEYIKETKLLAKALGLSTDAVLKQTEQAQKQWQLELLMMNPDNKASIQRMQAKGMSVNEILYAVGGIQSEEVAMTMALNKAKAIDLQLSRDLISRGEIRSGKDYDEKIAKSLAQNDAYNRAYNDMAQQQASGNMNWLMYTDEKMARAAGVGYSNEYNANKNISTLDREKEANSVLNQNIAAEEYIRAQEKIGQNNLEALTMLGDRLADTINPIADTMKAGNNILENLLKNETFLKYSGSILSKAAQIGVILGAIMPVLSTIPAAVTILGKTGSGITKLLGKSSGKVATKAAAKVGAKAIGKSLLKKIPLLSAGVGLALGAERLFSGDWKGAIGEVASGLASTVPGLGTATSVGIDTWLATRDMKNAPAIQNNQQQVLANSVSSNKAQLEAQAKIQAEAAYEASKNDNSTNNTEIVNNEVKSSKETNDTMIVKLTTEEEMQMKFSQMVSLMNDMNRQLSQMSFQIPNTNYSRV